MIDDIFCIDKRDILRPEYEITLNRCDEGTASSYKTKFKINKVLGRGGSSVVYKVEYYENSLPYDGVLKQLNPFRTDLNSEELKYYEEKFIQGYEFQCRFRTQYEDAKNITSNAQGLYIDKEKRTYYILTTLDGGTSYDNKNEDSILEILKTAEAVTKAVQIYHKNGYLHLDIKPENIFVLNETRDYIKLFDFDSIYEMKMIKESNAGELELPCSKGYSPLELLDAARYHNVSEKTDIYSIGALVYKKIFGEVYDGTYKIIDDDDRFENISPKIKNLLYKFFTKTLTIHRKRYADTEEVLIALKEMIEIAMPQNIFLATEAWSADERATGREKELKEIHKKLSENNVVFLHGMGGIGKSELAKMYAEKYKSEYDSRQFISYDFDGSNKNLKDVITELSFINLKESGLSTEELYKEKLQQFNKLDSRNLIVIDNFNVSYDPYIKNIINNKPCGAKVIFTTRNQYEDFNKRFYQVSAMDPDTACELFYKFYVRGLKNRNNNDEIVKQIIIKVQYNTLLIKLIGLLCENNYTAPQVILDALNESSLSNIEGEVRCTKDIYEDDNNKTIYNHLCTIFNVTNLGEGQKKVLMDLSFIGTSRIKLEKYLEMSCASINDLNRLKESGWIQFDNKSDMIFLHPIISEMAYKELGADEEKCSAFLNNLIRIDEQQWYFINLVSKKYKILKMIEKKIKNRSKVAAELYFNISRLSRHIFTEFNDKSELNNAIIYMEKSLGCYEDLYGELNLKNESIYFDLIIWLAKEYQLNLDSDTFKFNSYVENYINIFKKVYEDDSIEMIQVYQKILKVFEELKEENKYTDKHIIFVWEKIYSSINAIINIYEKMNSRMFNIGKESDIYKLDYNYKYNISIHDFLEADEEKLCRYKIEEIYCLMVNFHQELSNPLRNSAEFVEYKKRILGIDVNLSYEDRIAKYGLKESFQLILQEGQWYYDYKDYDRALDTYLVTLRSIDIPADKYVDRYMETGKLHDDLKVKIIKFSDKILHDEYEGDFFSIIITNYLYLCLFNITKIYKIKDEYDKSIYYCKIYLKVIENDKTTLYEDYKTLTILGELYKLKREYTKSIDCFEGLLDKINATEDFKNYHTKTLIRLGDIFIIQKEYDKALEYYKNAVAVLEKSPEKGSMEDKDNETIYFDILRGLGRVYECKGENTKAAEYFLLAGEKLVDLNQIDKSDIEKAVDVYKRAEKLYEYYRVKNLEHEYIFKMYFSIAAYYEKYESKSLNIALTYYLKALDIAEVIFDENTYNMALLYKKIAEKYKELAASKNYDVYINKYKYFIKKCNYLFIIKNKISLLKNNNTYGYEKNKILDDIKEFYKGMEKHNEEIECYKNMLENSSVIYGWDEEGFIFEVMIRSVDSYIKVKNYDEAVDVCLIMIDYYKDSKESYIKSIYTKLTEIYTLKNDNKNLLKYKIRLLELCEKSHVLFIIREYVDTLIDVINLCKKNNLDYMKYWKELIGYYKSHFCCYESHIIHFDYHKESHTELYADALEELIQICRMNGHFEEAEVYIEKLNEIATFDIKTY